MGIVEEQVLEEMARLEGKSLALIPREEWPVHLKHTTLIDIDAVVRLKTKDRALQEFLEESLKFLTPAPFEGYRTSRTLKSCEIPDEALAKFVHEYHKAEAIDMKEPLPEGVHGVNMWLHPELKQRFRIINEPHLNAAIAKSKLPRCRYPTRLGRRQALRNCKYLLQIDADAFYNSIPLNGAEKKFVFHKNGKFYALKTLPTGGRWSVATGQAIMWKIVDVDTGEELVIWTMIDNVIIGACEGQELEFFTTVREIVTRMKEVNMTTSPPCDELLQETMEQLLKRATEATTFLGETFTWNGKERTVTNSIKTIAKLRVALRKTEHTYRTFAGLVALVMYALHTVSYNAARTYAVMSAYRAVAKAAQTEGNWDVPMPYISNHVKTELDQLGEMLSANMPASIPAPRQATYDDLNYTTEVCIDASAHGWGAIIRHGQKQWTVQQRWITNLNEVRTALPSKAEPKPMFSARYSAHTEPIAAVKVIEHLMRKQLPLGRVAIITDHFAIVRAQRKLNGFGGIGRGAALNRLFHVANPLDVTFFYVSGLLNPADPLSRNFGVEDNDGQLTEGPADDISLPMLRTLFCPLCEEEEQRPSWMR